MTKNPRSGQYAVPDLFRGEWRALITLTNEAEIERVLRALPPAVERRRVSPATAVAVSGEREDQLIFADLTDAETLQESRGQSGSDCVCPIVYLATAEELESRWADVARLRLCSLLDIELVDDPVLFEAAVVATLGELGIDMQSLLDSYGLVDVYGIGSESQRRDAVGRVLDRLQSCELSTLQLTHYRLVVEEILTNAMRHASSVGQPNAADRRNAGGSHHVRQVTLTSVVTPELFAISVVDPAGSLTAEMVRQAISRQLAGDGDFDSGGRGLFIAYSLSNLVVITVDPGRRTEVAAFFRLALPEAHKALIINPNAKSDDSAS